MEPHAHCILTVCVVMSGFELTENHLPLLSSAGIGDVHACVCVCRGMCVYICGGQRTASGVLLGDTVSDYRGTR